jgi:hypothetical protein
VVYLHLAGSPPHLDLFDYKPELVRRNGQDCPQEFLRGRRFAFTSGTPKLLGTPQRFARHGRSGAWMSAAVPQLAGLADELCFVKSMFTDQFNHAPAELLLFTGSPQFGRPSMGSWVTYGLGSESQNLPGFIAAWWSRECASCSCTTGAGTSTAPATIPTWSRACPSSAGRWTNPWPP